MKYLKELDLSKKIVAFDTETTGSNPYGSLKKWGHYPARPFLFSFCDYYGNTSFIRWNVDPYTRQVLIDPESFRVIQSIIENPNITKVAHNLNFDIKMCHFIGLKFKGNFEDTLIASHVVTGGSDSHITGYALKDYCKKTMNYPDDDEKELEESAKQNRKDAKRKGWYIADS